MTRDDAKYAAELLQAYADGKTIQVRIGDIWTDLDDNPSFDLPLTKWNYRVKPPKVKWVIGLFSGSAYDYPKHYHLISAHIYETEQAGFIRRLLEFEVDQKF